MESPFSSKFVQLLSTFDESEIRSFDAWLRSPWCNRNKNLPRLLAQLRRYHPDFADDRLTKEKLFRKVLPDGKFSARRMNNLLSEAYLAAQRFLSFQRLANDDQLQGDLLLTDFRERLPQDAFLRAAQREIDALESAPDRGWTTHRLLYQHFRRMYHYPSQEVRMQPGNEFLTAMDGELERLYLLEKAVIINEWTMRKRIFQGERYQIEGARQRWLIASEGVEDPTIGLYRLRFEAIEHIDQARFKKIKERLIAIIDQMSEKHQKVLFHSLINDGLILVKADQLKLEQMLPLYQLGLEKKILLHENRLSRNTFITVVIASDTQGDFRYTRQFIDTYSSYLDQTIREDCLYWAEAHLAYWEGEEAQSLELLQTHAFQSPYFQLISRALVSQIYFDLYLRDSSFQEYLFSYLDAFEKWLGRNQVWSEATLRSFRRFVQKCRKLARLHGETDFRADLVAQLLEEPGDLQARDWLRERQKRVLQLRS